MAYERLTVIRIINLMLRVKLLEMGNLDDEFHTSFSSHFEALASELLANLEDMFPLSNLEPHTSVLSVMKRLDFFLVHS